MISKDFNWIYNGPEMARWFLGYHYLKTVFWEKIRLSSYQLEQLPDGGKNDQVKQHFWTFL